MRRRALPLALVFTLVASAGAVAQAQRAPVYRVYAVEYAVLPGFPLRGLVEGADSTQRIDIAMMVWLLKGAAAGWCSWTRDSTAIR